MEVFVFSGEWELVLEFHKLPSYQSYFRVRFY